MNIKDAYKIFNKLLKLCPKEYNGIDLFIYGGEDYHNYDLSKGAIAPTRCINLGLKLIEHDQTGSNIAFTLAHELGHHVLGHVSNGYDGDVHEEQDCDLFSLFLCQLLGYIKTDILEGQRKYEKWRASTIQSWHKKSHNSRIKRIERVEKQLEMLESINWKYS